MAQEFQVPRQPFCATALKSFEHPAAREAQEIRVLQVDPAALVDFQVAEMAEMALVQPNLRSQWVLEAVDPAAQHQAQVVNSGLSVEMAAVTWARIQTQLLFRLSIGVPAVAAETVAAASAQAQDRLELSAILAVAEEAAVVPDLQVASEVQVELAVME